MPDSPRTFQSADTVHIASDGHVAFDGHQSWYHAPPHLDSLFRTAQATRLDVRFTADPDCNNHAAELFPASPFDQIARACGRSGREVESAIARLIGCAEAVPKSDRRGRRL
jgi:hypothetical protein